MAKDHRTGPPMDGATTADYWSLEHEVEAWQRQCSLIGCRHWVSGKVKV